MKNPPSLAAKHISAKIIFTLTLFLSSWVPLRAMERPPESHQNPQKSSTTLTLAKELSLLRSSKHLLKNFSLSQFSDIHSLKYPFLPITAYLGTPIAYGPFFIHASGHLALYTSDTIFLKLMRFCGDYILTSSSKCEKEVIDFVISVAKKAGFESPEEIIILSSDTWMSHRTINRRYLFVNTEELHSFMKLPSDHLDRAAIEGIIVHELTHLTNNDTLKMIFASFAVPLITGIAVTALQKTFTKSPPPDSSSSAITQLLNLSTGIIMAGLNRSFIASCSRSIEFYADEGIKDSTHLKGVINYFDKELQHESQEPSPSRWPQVIKKTINWLKDFINGEKHPSIIDRKRRFATRLANLANIENKKSNDTNP